MFRSVPVLKQISSLALILVCLSVAALFLGSEMATLLKTPSTPAQAFSGGKLPIRSPNSVNGNFSKPFRRNKPSSTINGNRQWLDGSNLEANRNNKAGSDRVSEFELKKAPSKVMDFAITNRTKNDSEKDAAQFSISGRVSSEWGDGISGIHVFASAQRLFSDDQREDFPRAQSEHRTLTDDAGFYEFRELTSGDYEIHTAPTQRFPGARLQVRAGTKSADILLLEARSLRIYGRVADTDGIAVAEALVQPISQGSTVATDAKGNYTLEISIGQQGESYAFDVSMPGYSDKRFGIREEEVRGLDEIRVDVQLEPVGATTAVEGRVMDEDGNPVQDAAVRLYSPVSKQSFQALTTLDGDFSLPAVIVGDDYQLWVHAGEEFNDYVEQPLNIPAEGLDLTVELQSVKMTSLSGRMVDASGIPIPWFGLWLRSSDTAATLGKIVGDRDGYFHIENLPAGNLSVQTQIPPYLSVNGINLTSAGDDPVELILDWGDLKIQGKVSDELGNPIYGAEISASWSLQDGSLHSRSSRRTTSNNNGDFEFSGLGPGIHALSIQASGYKGAWAEIDPLTDRRHILIALEKPHRHPTSN